MILLGNLAWSLRANDMFVSSHAVELLGPQFKYNIGRGERAMYIVVREKLFPIPIIWLIYTDTYDKVHVLLLV